MDKQNNKMLKTSILGFVASAVCCFTPLLVILLGAAGLGAFTGYLDYVLLPVACAFLMMIFYGIMKRKKSHSHYPCCEEKKGNRIT